jgi:hypothetical protein
MIYMKFSGGPAEFLAKRFPTLDTDRVAEGLDDYGDRNSVGTRLRRPVKRSNGLRGVYLGRHNGAYVVGIKDHGAEKFRGTEVFITEHDMKQAWVAETEVFNGR